ncbi:MAG: hypothetical protein BroJett040_16400 [Oligoflexia bacterium]|nr:MAG: hypothetical protein BroJett040_16400 [Oligoflexia bacterium]
MTRSLQTSNQNQKTLLREILTKITQIIQNRGRALVVFDLDSTLFDVSPRLQKILHDFAHNPDNQSRFPESCEILKEAETLRSDWGIKNALVRAGLDNHHPDFHLALKTFWLESFFSNHYLQYDKPYEGAAEYVNQLHQAGAEIVYLTGRDIPRMNQGTLDVLKKWNFPIHVPRAEVVLKPEKGLDDAQFKTDWFAALPEGVYQGIWFFENEPVNVNLVRDTHEHVEIVFFESTHAGKAEPPTELPRIMHYLLD